MKTIPCSAFLLSLNSALWVSIQFFWCYIRYVSAFSGSLPKNIPMLGSYPITHIFKTYTTYFTQWYLDIQFSLGSLHLISPFVWFMLHLGSLEPERACGHTLWPSNLFPQGLRRDGPRCIFAKIPYFAKIPPAVCNQLPRRSISYFRSSTCVQFGSGPIDLKCQQLAITASSEKSYAAYPNI